MEKEQLINFEAEVKQMFLDGKLRSPVHLSGGNEEQLIAIFKDINKDDWVFTNYRSHYHALLKGVPEDRLKQWILDNKSIHFMDSEYKVFSSAIVGGTLPIALGVAWAIKRKGGKNKVWLFTGDMTAELGVFNDCVKYARRNDLPIIFVVEDNGMSTDTVTQEAWGKLDGGPNTLRYKYRRTYPHYGVGAFVKF
jgi:pyruvate dehydrogenase E1 component alpha subunit